jgi:hypothetical protein
MDVESYIEELQQKLGLTHWLILLEQEWNGMGGESAQVVYQQDERIATIQLLGSTSEADTPHLIRHEMLHILLTDLEFIACNGRSTDTMDLFNRELERVINQLSRAISEG